jgi:hypothetical protein
MRTPGGLWCDLWWSVEGGTREQAEAEMAQGGGGASAGAGSGGNAEAAGGDTTTGLAGGGSPASVSGAFSGPGAAVAGLASQAAPEHGAFGAPGTPGTQGTFGGPTGTFGGSPIGSRGFQETVQAGGAQTGLAGICPACVGPVTKILAGPLAPIVGAITYASRAFGLGTGVPQTSSSEVVAAETGGGPIEGGAAGNAATFGTQPATPSSTLGGGAAYYGVAGGPGTFLLQGGVIPKYLSPQAGQDLSGLPVEGGGTTRRPCTVLGIPCWIVILAVVGIGGYFVYRYYKKRQAAKKS